MAHHGAALQKLGVEDEVIERITADYRRAGLSARMAGILSYAVKLTQKPHTVTDVDVEGLRDLGCSDREILDICQVTAYFNFVNRMADGLGVQLEE